MKSRKAIASKFGGTSLEAQQSDLHSCWRSLAVLLIAATFCSAMLAKTAESFKYSIKITYASEIGQGLKVLQATEPIQAALRKKIITTADTFLQHYMNGDMNQMEIPDDWKKKNGWFMGVTMGDWEKLVNRQTDKNFTEWNVCPSARMVSITRAPSATVIRYEFLTVGRFTMQDKFSTAESGKPVFVDVSLNDQTRVIDRKLTPQGASASPYTRVDEYSSICRLKNKGK